ncbi:MAG: phytanoyl-CoA dioxygenase family protein, partial [Gammaproteobacteria bacterium]|nr:phytanoyl-CoA dioxygenase family protein [Gammaproteobacteria bacterium]
MNEHTAHLKNIEEQGYTLIENALPSELVDAVSEALLRLETEFSVQPGCNLFEGNHTIRIYNLLARDPIFQQVPVHPLILPIIENVLDKGCLVSSLSSISIDSGERAQPIHADDTLIGLPRPHQAVVCNSMWALTDFTEENGATRIVPGSHKYKDKPEYGTHPESIAAEMTKGSVLIWNGSLW